MDRENQLLEIIRSRRSVRKFKDAPIDREVIEKVIDAGNHAPSPGNLQQWRFVVIREAEILAGIRDAGRPVYQRLFDGLEDPVSAFFVGPYARSRGWTTKSAAEFRTAIRAESDPAFYGAPVMIVVIATAEYMVGTGCPMVCLNMLLAAHSLGLGSLCTTSGNPAFDVAPGQELVDLSELEKIVACVLIGEPALMPDSPPKNAPLVKWI